MIASVRRDHTHSVVSQAEGGTPRPKRLTGRRVGIYLGSLYEAEEDPLQVFERCQGVVADDNQTM